jgi:hypothetical protein
MCSSVVPLASVILMRLLMRVGLVLSNNVLADVEQDITTGQPPVLGTLMGLRFALASSLIRD